MMDATVLTPGPLGRGWVGRRKDEAALGAVLKEGRMLQK